MHETFLPVDPCGMEKESLRHGQFVLFINLKSLDFTRHIDKYLNYII